MASVRGADTIFNAAGVQLAPLGFGFQADWETIGRVTGSAVASLDQFVDADVYDEIEVTYEIEVATDVDELWLRMSDNGSTFLSGASDYDYINNGDQNRGGASFETEGDGATHIELALNIGDDANGGAIGEIQIGHLSSGFRTKISALCSYLDGDATQGTISTKTAGNHASAATFRGIQLLASTGNISGSMTVRGRRITPVSLVSQDDWVVISDNADVAAAATHDFFWDDQVFDEIEISIWGILTGTDDRDLDIRLSSDGSTFHSGATDYRFATINHNDAGGSSFTNDSTGAAEAKVAFSLGTVADELQNSVLKIQDVSSITRKKQGTWHANGILANATYQRFEGTFIDTNTNDSCRGIQLRGESAATMAFDRVRIRGRRKTPIGVLKQDWEVIERRSVTTSADEEFFWSQEWDEIQVTLQRITSTTDNIDMEFTLSTDGSTFHTGGTDYTVVRFNTNDDPLDASQDQGGARIPLIGLGDQANEAIAAVMHIFDVGTDGEVKPIILDQTGLLANGSTTRDHYGAVMTVNTNAIRGINVGMGAGNTFSGEIVIRGRRKAT
jgi:hypothetical protein